MIGSAARNDHALLMGCTQAPNHRYNLIHRLREVLETKKEKKVLSSQEFDGGTAEEGYRYLSSSPLRIRLSGATRPAVYR